MTETVPGTADLCDAHEAQVAVAAPIFRSFGGRPRFHGPIATLRCFEDNSLVREWLAQPGAGRVLVVDGGGSLRCALLGDQLGALGVKNGWSGVIVHGCVRDTVALGAMDLGVLALAAAPAEERQARSRRARRRGHLRRRHLRAGRVRLRRRGRRAGGGGKALTGRRRHAAASFLPRGADRSGRPYPRARPGASSAMLAPGGSHPRPRRGPAGTHFHFCSHDRRRASGRDDRRNVRLSLWGRRHRGSFASIRAIRLAAMQQH